MDIFSVEPPMLSRFADPYDQEVPPAPPDDPAAEALSPVPQWPDNRLLVPVEGTGYLDLLEYWRRDQEAQGDEGRAVRATERARILAACRQRPPPDHRPAPAGNAGPALDSPAGPPDDAGRHSRIRHRFHRSGVPGRPQSEPRRVERRVAGLLVHLATDFPAGEAGCEAARGCREQHRA